MPCGAARQRPIVGLAGLAQGEFRQFAGCREFFGVQRLKGEGEGLFGQLAAGGGRTGILGQTPERLHRPGVEDERSPQLLDARSASVSSSAMAISRPADNRTKRFASPPGALEASSSIRLARPKSASLFALA